MPYEYTYDSNFFANPQVVQWVACYINQVDLNDTVNLPGVEETVIIKAVPSRGGLALHSAGLKRAISPNVGDSDA